MKYKNSLNQIAGNPADGAGYLQNNQINIQTSKFKLYGVKCVKLAKMSFGTCNNVSYGNMVTYIDGSCPFTLYAVV